MNHYRLRLHPALRPLLLLIGATPSRAFADVDASGVALRMGYFRLHLPHDDIVAAEPAAWPLRRGFGLRFARGGVFGLVGHTQGVVELRLRSPREVSVLGLRLPVERVALSLERPDAFLSDLRQRLRAAPPDVP